MVMVWEGVEKCISELLGLSSKPEVQLSSKPEVLKFIGIGMGGVLIALQALMSYKRAKAMEVTAKAHADAVLNTEQGLRQERLKNAIEHLGHEKDSVRLGGAYELFHLAEDTQKLRQTVLAILCAYIRQTTGESAYCKTHQSEPSEEVQSLLTLLFVQEHDVFKGLRINLKGSYLNGANIKEARLEKAVLTKAHLQEASLVGAHLQEASLRQAQLQGAFLGGAHLQGAFLSWAQLQEARLRGAHLQGASLRQAQLQGAKLGGAHLQGAYLREAHLQGANLYRAQLQGASLRQAQLQGADLRRAQLQGASLDGAQLQGASLDGAQLQGASLDGAQLQGASLDGAHLQGAGGKAGGTFKKRIRKKIGVAMNLSGVHFDKPPSSQLPNGAIPGIYSKEEAKNWIAEYDKAMSAVPKQNENT